MSGQDKEAAAARLREARLAEGRCLRCGNWPDVCGHGIPFAERIKTVAIDRSSLK